MNKYLIFIAALLSMSPFDSAYAEPSVTEKRQTTFERIEEKTEHLEDLIDDKNWWQSEQLASQIALDVETLKQLFPIDSKGKGRSKEKIWQDWRKFEGKLDNWSHFYEQVAKASNKHDARAVERSIDKASSACRSCHMKYRSIW